MGQEGVRWPGGEARTLFNTRRMSQEFIGIAMVLFLLKHSPAQFHHCSFIRTFAISLNQCPETAPGSPDVLTLPVFKGRSEVSVQGRANHKAHQFEGCEFRAS